MAAKQADDTESYQFTPTQTDIAILQALSEAGQTLKQFGLEQAAGYNRSVLRPRLEALEQAGMIYRPHGKRSGYAPTNAGSAIIEP